ncbi:alpha/beta hydrolase [Variovorax guangxiensis]|uniref:alpha/beta fold hydrolase n=1 Tax=Variovorax guangxiensis TaxID=1775474 RepID=UPI002865B1AC|nr:alpha/beta hydrolase [Variovorax guangxiensis]MDR6858503.1 pimeloyl-ACP methyl ester carboxylesterase [Variovorax guangxiensis]
MNSLLKNAVAAAAIGLTITAGAGSAGSALSAAAPPTTVEQVHGAFADGSAWNRVVPLEQAKDLKVVSVQNPLTSLADHVAATRRVLDAQIEPVVLVGHSWGGGVVISEAGQHERVKALVHVAAFAPAEGQSVAELSKSYPTPAGSEHIVADKESFLRLTQEGVSKHFAQDMPAAETMLMAITQGPVRGANFEERTPTSAWKTRPSRFIVSRQDHMIQPDLQQAMAKTIGAQVVSLPTSQVPQQSRPEDVAHAITAVASR